MAKRKTTTKTLRILRLVLLLGLVGFIAIVIGLYRFGKAGLPTGGSDGAEAPAAQEGDEVFVGEDFDYVVTRGEEPIARIRADRVLAQEEDEIVLEGLNPVEVYREDGSLYRVFSDSGTYNFDTQETTLQGNVRVEGPRGLELFAEGLSMGRQAQTITSQSPVRFIMAGEFMGRARNLRANLGREIFTLSGQVAINSTSPEREPIRLTCGKLSYDRDAGLLRTSGNVRFERGGSYLHAPEMQFHLTEDERKVRYVSAQDGVAALSLRRIGATIERQLELTGDELAAVIDPDSGEPLEAEVRTAGGQIVRLWTTDETSLVRSLTAPVLHARFVDGELSYAEAYESVHLREFLAFDRSHILNWACGERAEVSFAPDGEIRQATFHGRVEFRNAQGLAQGDRIDMTGEPYRITMMGDPARVVGVQGELTAPEIVQQGEGGEVRAQGGVRGLFEQSGGKAALSVGGAKGPVRLESRSAVWNRELQSFKFNDDVRLWQEENLLLADEIETQTDKDLVIARGSVKTILVPEAEVEEPGGEAADASEQAPAETESGMSRDPIEVTSRLMEYGLETRTIVYREDVEISQIGRLMVCDVVEAQMVEEGGVETLDCQGNVRVDDRVARRSVSGDTAFYELALGEITFTGRPVILTGERGEHIEGRTLIYDLESGGARIGAGEDPSPAISEDGSTESEPSEAVGPGTEGSTEGS